MDKTTPQKLKLGIFVIFAIILLLSGTYLIGNQENLFGKTFTIYANFKNASGLKKGDNVRFSGLNIGTVNQIEMINDTVIKVDMTIQNQMKNFIKSNAIASIGSDGIVGSTIINIVPGKGNAPNIQTNKQIQTNNKVSTQEMLTTLNGTNNNIEKLSKNLLKITTSLNNGYGTLGALLKDSIMSVSLQQTFTNLNNASSEANKTIATLNRLVKHINVKTSVAGVLLNDSDSGEKVKNLVTNLEAASQKFETITTDLGGLTSKLNGKDNIINYLATDTVLVKQVKDMMKNADQSIERFNDNMEALEHNFFFKGYFKKQQKLKDKAAKNKNKGN